MNPPNLPSKKIIVYLVDLTHTGQLVASNVHPYGIGLIAAYMKEFLNDNLHIELFGSLIKSVGKIIKK
ncbi:MAG: hypothetical protein GY699_26935 [Desulfobacteraceae bacterium]|nr:hypothetical protein [Desulfobacteraceae bacterium]